MEKIGIKGIPVNQNGQDFIIGKATIREILTYTKYTERLILGYDEEERPIYNKDIQRKVEMNRVNKIADFLINDNYAIFPTNIVLGIPLSVIERQVVHDGIVEIDLIDDVIRQVERAKKGDENADIYVTIIDGQHRIKGIEVAIERLNSFINNTNTSEKERAFFKLKLSALYSIEVVVAYFIDKSLEYQAMIFSTINRTQKRVSQDLVMSLFGLSTNDSPYKTALEVVLALNGHPKSPFYKRVKLYGGDYDRRSSPPLSQATMIKSIVALISENLREAENDKYRDRRDLLGNTKKFLPFRSFYARNEDAKISDCLFYFFNTVRSFLGDYWDFDGLTTPQNILQSTVGYEALLRLLVEILFKENIIVFSNESFIPYIKRITDIQFNNTDKFPMSTRGRSILFLTMSIAVFPAESPNDERVRRLREIDQ